MGWFRKAKDDNPMHDDDEPMDPAMIEFIPAPYDAPPLPPQDPCRPMQYPSPRVETLYISDTERQLYLDALSSLDEPAPQLILHADPPPQLDQVRVNSSPLVTPNIPYPTTPQLKAKVSSHTKHGLLTLVDEGGLRFTGFSSQAIIAADAAIRGTWKFGISARSDDPEKLKTSQEPIVYRVELKGKAWNRKGSQELESIRLLLAVFTSLGKHGFMVGGSVAAMGKTDTHTLLFRAVSVDVPFAPLFFALSLPLPDRLALVSPPETATEDLVSAIRGSIFEVASEIKMEGWLHPGVYRFWIAGMRRFGSVKSATMAKVLPPLMVNVMDSLSALHFEFVTSIPLEPSSPRRDIIIFASTPQSGLSMKDAYVEEAPRMSFPQPITDKAFFKPLPVPVRRASQVTLNDSPPEPSAPPRRRSLERQEAAKAWPNPSQVITQPVSRPPRNPARMPNWKSSTTPPDSARDVWEQIARQSTPGRYHLNLAEPGSTYQAKERGHSDKRGNERGSNKDRNADFPTNPSFPRKVPTPQRSVSGHANLHNHSSSGHTTPSRQRTVSAGHFQQKPAARQERSLPQKQPSLEKQMQQRQVQQEKQPSQKSATSGGSTPVGPTTTYVKGYYTKPTPNGPVWVNGIIKVTQEPKPTLNPRPSAESTSSQSCYTSSEDQHRLMTPHLTTIHMVHAKQTTLPHAKPTTLPPPPRPRPTLKIPIPNSDSESDEEGRIALPRLPPKNALELQSLHNVRLSSTFDEACKLRLSPASEFSVSTGSSRPPGVGSARAKVSVSRN